jgi:DNA-binding winged helix-turn-helix (wHTH) protein
VNNEITFGPFVLSVTQRRLWRNGSRVALKPREAELLAVLAEHRPRALGKDELIERLWGGAATDAALAQTVYRLRQKLEGFAGHHSFIRTIPGVGFQFSGDSPFESAYDRVEGLRPEFMRYQQAVAEYRKRTELSITSAIRSLEGLRVPQARFRPGLVTLARAYMNAGVRSFMQPEEAYSSARNALRDALAIDASDPDAHATLATTLLYFDGDRERAHTAVARALVLMPHSGFARKAAVWDRLAYRDLEGALAQADLLMRTTPASAQAVALFGVVLYMSRRFVEAQSYLDVALSLDSSNATARYYAVAACLVTGADQRAEKLLLSCPQGENVCAIDGLRGAFAAMHDDHETCTKIVKRISAGAFPARLPLCLIALAQGDFVRAESLIRAALKTREPSQFLLLVDPMYASLFEAFPDLAGTVERRSTVSKICERCGDELCPADADGTYAACDPC